MYKEGSAKEGAVLMKSIIMYTTRPLEFHIVCDDVAMTYLESRFRLLTHPLYPITVRFYRLSFQAMVDRVAREGSLNTGHAAGTTGLMKLFMHEVLPESVGKAIFVDTDAFFLTDPALLWDEFSRWGPNVAVSIPYHPNMPYPAWYNASMICSCIMLFDLAKLRSMRLMDSSIYRADHSGLFPPAFAPPTFRKLFGPPGPHGYHHVALGDQSYWWAIVSERREIFEPLPLDWEVTSCLLDMYGAGLGDDGVTEEEESKRMVHLEETPLEGKAIHPKLLHFNCLDGVPQYYDWPDWSNPELSLVKRWKPAVEYHVGFKWIWLNRGRTSSPVDIQLIADPLFADQRFAAEHPEHIADSSTATAQRRRGHIRSFTKLH
ncbi:hypothetical protein BC826DRAFT_913080 [Russula brevipes]|nr:hypothetical protein BC826DRAFT_913080 [Russula brevipes]